MLIICIVAHLVVVMMVSNGPHGEGYDSFPSSEQEYRHGTQRQDRDPSHEQFEQSMIKMNDL